MLPSWAAERQVLYGPGLAGALNQVMAHAEALKNRRPSSRRALARPGAFAPSFSTRTPRSFFQVHVSLAWHANARHFRALAFGPAQG